MDTLLVGYKASDLTPELLSGDVTCHVLDIYHQHAIQARFPKVKVVCSAHLPTGDWGRIRFRTGPKLQSGELELDLMQECYAILGSKVELDYVGRESDRNRLLDKMRDYPKRIRTFRAEWTASVPGGRVLTLASYPGCFCHRRQDQGGLALAEVAVANTQPKADASPIKVLDMGCGCGLVGLLIADSIPDVNLTMIDSHSRAVEAANENVKATGANARVLMADDGIASLPDEFGTFDVFVGNPPYYSDYRIADVFLETAKRALKPGGVCWTVAKNAAGLKPVQERYFPLVEVIPRRGYSVLKSVQG